MEAEAGFPVHHGGRLLRYLWDCSRKFPYCSVLKSWLAAVVTGAFLTVTQALFPSSSYSYAYADRRFVFDCLRSRFRQAIILKRPVFLPTRIL